MKKYLTILILLVGICFGTVTDQAIRTSYSTNGSTTAFTFSFKVYAAGDVEVILRTDSTGAESTLTENTHYTVAIPTPETGGTITTVATYASGYTLVIRRKAYRGQDLDLVEGGAISAESLEDEYDRGVMSNQSLLEMLARALMSPTSDSSDLVMTIPNSVDRAGKVLGFDSTTGEPTAVDALSTSTVSISTFMETVLDDTTAVSALATLQGTQVFNVKNPLYGTAGAVGDGVADDGDEIQAALDAAAANGGIVFFPPGEYLFATGLTKAKGVSIRGSGIGENNLKITQLVYSGTGKALSISLTINDVDQSTISDFDLLCSSTADAGIYVINAQQLRIRNVQVDNYTNSGTYGLHIDGGSHWLQVVDCQMWGQTCGIYSVRSTVVDDGEVRNNATLFERVNVAGDERFIYFDDIHGAVIRGVEVNQTIDPTEAVIEFKDCAYCSIHGGYFEPFAGQQQPMIKFSGTTVNSRIINNDIGCSGSSATAVIIFTGTSGRNMIVANSFYGTSDTVASIDNDGAPIVDIFANNTIPEAWLTAGKPPIIGSGNFHIEHKGWFSGIFHEVDTMGNNATPTVLNKNMWISGGTTTITDFDDGVTGQVITVLAEHSLTIDDQTNILLGGNIDWAMQSGDTLTLVQKADTYWYELGRSHNTSGEITITNTVELSSTDIKALAGTPIKLVIAQGADTVIEFVSALLIYDAAVAYVEPSAPDDMVIEYDTGTDLSASIDATGFVTVTDDEMRLIPSTLALTTDLVPEKNAAIQLLNTGTDYTT
ncbi:MAG TPA: hypothetical protein ENI05_06600, partial [Porticoccus sp.]|nr:hypothetical protein [Porticoccus sp.]